MPGIENNLYPPIIATWMPAFVRSGKCKVYFSLSIYNNLNDITNAQVIVNNQSDNRSALNTKTYPTGIKICNILEDEEKIDDKYYIEIDPGDLTNNIFGLNQFYKVQIRFTGKDATDVPDSGQIAAWLNQNQEFFSEWSTVCLIKGIEKPSISLKGFNTSSTVTFYQEMIDLVGKMYYPVNGKIEKETLKSYNVKLYNHGNLIYDSGDVYTNAYNPNEINYTLKVHLEDQIQYKLVFTYTTINEYTDSVTYNFFVSRTLIDPLLATIEAIPDIEYGRIKINIKSSGAFSGGLVIRRTSNETNYTIWEDIHQITLNTETEPLEYVWYDYTVESGMLYKYGAQRKRDEDTRGQLIIIKNPVLIELDDIFLTRADLQFKVRFDPDISNFKYTYSEAKIDTLGSQYPYFYRNGNIKYRQFSISGLITAWCDDQGVFINKENIYKESKEDYDLYNQKENISEYRDYIYERKFREKIIDFLYADNVKLFRSPTEGNILIRLMDVSLTPNPSLGRMLYSFSANAYEIDDCNLDNFQKYGIQSIGKI